MSFSNRYDDPSSELFGMRMLPDEPVEELPEKEVAELPDDNSDEDEDLPDETSDGDLPDDEVLESDS